MNGRVKVVVFMFIWGSVGIFGRLFGLSGFGVVFVRVFLGVLVLFMVIGLIRMELLREFFMIF